MGKILFRLNLMLQISKVSFDMDTFGISCHKINSEEINISGETLIRPYGD